MEQQKPKEPEIRPLARQEQLEWLIPFLYSQKAQIEADIAAAEAEYKNLTEGAKKVYKR